MNGQQVSVGASHVTVAPDEGRVRVSIGQHPVVVSASVSGPEARALGEALIAQATRLEDSPAPEAPKAFRRDAHGKAYRLDHDGRHVYVPDAELEPPALKEPS